MYNINTNIPYINAARDTHERPLLLYTRDLTNKSNNIDAINAGAQFNAGPMTIGLGLQSVSSDAVMADDIVGISVGGNFGDFGVTLLFEDDGTNNPMHLTATFGSFMAQVGDDDGDNSSVSLGYAHALSKKVKMEFDVHDRDDWDDAKFAAQLKVDF